MKTYRQGMVFGVFDGLHEGHKHFLSSAQAVCEKLIVVVAPDSAAIALKGRAPKHPLEERIAAIAAFNGACTVLAGDEIPGSWNVLLRYEPDVVILGYDQEAIAKELVLRSVPYLCLDPHEPERFKSSILNAEKPIGGEES